MLNRSILLSAMIALASAAQAQETAPSDLNMGATEGEGPAIGQFYVRQTFDDWVMRCVKTEEEQDPCQLYQLLRDAEGNAVAEISMFPLPEGSQAAAGATIVVPLETLLTENLKISVDGGAARVYPYSFCNQAGCVARIGFTADDIAAFKAGNAGKLSMVPAAAPEETVSLDISLKGFTAGFEAPLE